MTTLGTQTDSLYGLSLRSVPVATTARMVYGYLQAYETDWTYHSDLYLWLK